MTLATTGVRCRPNLKQSYADILVYIIDSNTANITSRPCLRTLYIGDNISKQCSTCLYTFTIQFPHLSSERSWRFRSVGFNFLGRDFFNSIAEKQPDVRSVVIHMPFSQPMSIRARRNSTNWQDVENLKHYSQSNRNGTGVAAFHLPFFLISRVIAFFADVLPFAHRVLLRHRRWHPLLCVSRLFPTAPCATLAPVDD